MVLPFICMLSIPSPCFVATPTLACFSIAPLFVPVPYILPCLCLNPCKRFVLCTCNSNPSRTVTGLGAHLVAASTTQRVATEHQFRDAVANCTIDTIDVTSSFVLTESAEIFIDRSLRIVGSCDAPPGKGCCAIGVAETGPAQALHVQAAAPDMRVAIQGICFFARTEALQSTSSHTAVQCSSVYSTRLEVTDASFSNFYAESGTFAVTGTGCAVTCTNCAFFNNRAIFNGGAVYLNFGYFTCSGCAFSSNRAMRGGAIYVTTGSQMEIYFPTFSQNVATMGGPDVYVENAPFAALTVCPSSASVNYTGSPRAPVRSSFCALGEPDQPSTPDATSPPRPSTETPPIPILDGIPPASSALVLHTSSGVSQVPAGYLFGLQGVLTIGMDMETASDKMLNLSIQNWGQEGNCSGFLLESVTLYPGSCDNPATACSASCHMGRVNSTSLHMSLRAVAVGAQLVVAASITSPGQAAVEIPVRLTDGFGVEGEPVRATDALRPIIAPRPGAGNSIRRMPGDQQSHVFVGASEVLRFTVIGPGLGACDITAPIQIDGPGRVVNVTAGVDGSLLSFVVLARPDSAMILHVVAGACAGVDGRPSLASEPFPMIVDLDRPLATVTCSGNGRLPINTVAVFLIQFSEQVSGFSKDGLDVTGGYVTCMSAINASEGTYEAVVQPLEGVSLLSLFVKEGAALDKAFNPSKSSTVTVHLAGPLPSRMVKLLHPFLKFFLATITLVTLARGGEGQGRLVALIGHVQFFQMVGRLDVPLDIRVLDVLSDLAWVNHAWPQPMFGLGDEAPKNISQYGSSTSPPHLLFPSNGSCQQPPGSLAVNASIDDLHRRRLGDVVFDRITLAELNNLVQEAYPPVPAFHPMVHDDLRMPPSSQADFWSIVLLCLCLLAACLALRAFCVVAWRVINWVRPRRWCEALPAILRFPRLELLVLMLTYPAMAHACVFYATSGFKLGVVVGICVGAAYPLAFAAFVAYFLLYKVIWSQECRFRPERIYLVDSLGNYEENTGGYQTIDMGDSSVSSHLGVATSKRPFFMEASWTNGTAALSRDYVLLYGILFEDLKGPTRDMGDVSGGASLGGDSRRSSDRVAWPSDLPDLTCPNMSREADTQKVSRGQWPPKHHEPGYSLCASNCCPVFTAKHNITRGHLAASYTLLVILKQLAFASLAGISSRHLGLTHLGWFQVAPWIILLPLQMGYLIVVKPFIWNVPNSVELLATLCELTTMGCCLGLLIAQQAAVTSMTSLLSILLAFAIGFFGAAALFELLYNSPTVIRRCWQVACDKLPTWLLGPRGPTQGGDMTPAGMTYWAFHPLSSPTSLVQLKRTSSVVSHHSRSPRPSNQSFSNRSNNKSAESFSLEMSRSTRAGATLSRNPSKVTDGGSMSVQSPVKRKLAMPAGLATAEPMLDEEARHHEMAQGTHTHSPSKRQPPPGAPKIMKVRSYGDLSGQVAGMDDGATPGEGCSVVRTSTVSVGKGAARHKKLMMSPGEHPVGNIMVHWEAETGDPGSSAALASTRTRRASASDNPAVHGSDPTSITVQQPPSATTRGPARRHTGPAIIDASRSGLSEVKYCQLKSTDQLPSISPLSSLMRHESFALPEVSGTCTTGRTSARNSMDAIAAQSGSRSRRPSRLSLPIDIPAGAGRDWGQERGSPGGSRMSPSGSSPDSCNSGKSLMGQMSPGNSQPRSPLASPSDWENGSAHCATDSGWLPTRPRGWWQMVEARIPSFGAVHETTVYRIPPATIGHGDRFPDKACGLAVAPDAGPMLTNYSREKENASVWSGHVDPSPPDELSWAASQQPTPSHEDAANLGLDRQVRAARNGDGMARMGSLGHPYPTMQAVLSPAFLANRGQIPGAASWEFGEGQQGPAGQASESLQGAAAACERQGQWTLGRNRIVVGPMSLPPGMVNCSVLVDE
eukprot:jgi/Mesvir1/7178/Mv15059-RA.1